MRSRLTFSAEQGIRDMCTGQMGRLYTTREDTRIAWSKVNETAGGEGIFKNQNAETEVSQKQEEAAVNYTPPAPSLWGI